MTSKQRQNSLSRRFLVKLIQWMLVGMGVVLLGGGSALFWLLQFELQSSHASDLTVVGQPSLPAASVDAIFTRLGSPMAGTGKVVEQASRQVGIDDAFALGVWWTETNDGAAGVGRADLNPGSVRGSRGFPVAYDGYTIYPSYTVAITEWFKLLKNNYVNKGLNTVYTIANPYVGTSSAPLWAGKVVALMVRYRGEAPAPTPTATSISFTKQQQLQKIMTDPEPAKNSTQTTTQNNKHTATLSVNISSVKSTDPISPGMLIAIVLFGLIAALILALLGLWIERHMPQQIPVSTISANVPPAPETLLIDSNHQEYSVSVSPPASELQYPINSIKRPIPETPVMPVWDIPSENRVAPSVRRITLLPSNDKKFLDKTDAPDIRSNGLLSRYNETTNK